MPSRHISIRIDAESFDRLERESQRMQLSRSEVARTLIEEGLRMEAHPGIVFRPGPTGRRAGLKNGPDVWEVIGLYKDMDGPGEDALQRTCEWAALRPDQVKVALGYYAEFPQEIDERIRLNEEAAERGYAEWVSQQQALKREATA